VWIYSEYSKGKSAALSSGYAISLSAETITGKRITTDQCMRIIGNKKDNDISNHPEEMGKRCALQLIEEIMYSGVIDTTFQSFVLFLMALSEKAPSVVKLGRVSEFTIENVRLVKAFTGVLFKIEELDSDNRPEERERESDKESEDGMKEEKIETEFVPPKCVMFTC